MDVIERDRRYDFQDTGFGEEVLCLHHKGRPLRTISKVPGQNGFEAHRLLVHENMPKSQVRNFHLLQNIINFKAKSEKSLNENVLAFEQLIEDYKKISYYYYWR